MQPVFVCQSRFGLEPLNQIEHANMQVEKCVCAKFQRVKACLKIRCWLPKVKEPSQCVYEATMTHPAACDPKDFEVEDRVLGPHEAHIEL